MLPTSQLKDILATTWGYSTFRPLQAEAMQCVLDRRDSLVVLPTGGGKSICFQAPALLAEGMTVVVSPLISLMKDQVDALRQVGVSAACVNSALSALERRETDAAIRSGELRLLYVAPERLMKDDFAAYLLRANIASIVIDEAHCISQWGHDFRPEYRELGRLREYFPGLAVHAFTATATPQVRGDILKQLRLVDPAVLIGSFDRPNLVYHVEEARAKDEAIQRIIDRHPGESGIVYCITRKNVEAVCESLCARGIDARPYHAGLSDTERRDNQEAFVRDRIQIIVATVAFGMGIDKPDVRFVIHAGMPKSLEHYQQEAGRAGRDGLEAECCLIYSNADYGLWRSIMEKNGPEGASVQLDKLSAMLQYCKSTACRHSQLCEYFGEPPTGTACGACDVCLGSVSRAEDAADLARKILGAVEALEQRFGAQHVTRVLTGEREEKIVRFRHHKLDCFGALANESARDVRDWVESLAAQGYLVRADGQYPTLSLSSVGTDFLYGHNDTEPLLQQRSEKRVRARAVAPSHALAALGPEDRAFFQRLRAVRLELASEMGVPPYMVLSDAAIRDIAVRKPLESSHFAKIHGIGQKKLEQLGPIFLQHVNDYCEEMGILDQVHASWSGTAPVRTAPAPSAPKAGPKKEKSAPKAQADAYAMFARGASVEEVAEALFRAPSTVASYLDAFLRANPGADISPWLTETDYQRVCEAARSSEDGRLKPIFEALNAEVPYDKIRLALLRAQRES